MVDLAEQIEKILLENYNKGYLIKEVARTLANELVVDEEKIKEILQLELCNGTTDCENYPECPTEDGCQPMDLAHAIAQAKGIIKMRGEKDETTLAQ